MDLESLRAMLGWATLLSYGLLLLWFAMLVMARDFVKRLHGRWFRLSDAAFDAIHYGAMAALKLGTWLFLFAPWLALHIIA